MTDQMHAAPEQPDAASNGPSPTQPAPNGPVAEPDGTATAQSPPQQPQTQQWPQQEWPPAQQQWPPAQQWPPQSGMPQQGWQQYPYPPAAPRKSRFGVGILVGIAIGFGAAVIGFMVLGFLFALGGPERLGDSAITDALYAECDRGDMGACDALYWEAAPGSELEDFGATCGDRTRTWQSGECETADIGPQ